MVFYMIVDLSTHSNMEQHEHPGLITISVVIGEIAIATHTAQRETFLGIISTDVTNLGAQTTSQFAWLLSIYILFWNKATQNFIIKDTSPSQFKMVEFEKHTVILHKMRSKVQKENNFLSNRNIFKLWHSHLSLRSICRPGDRELMKGAARIYHLVCNEHLERRKDKHKERQYG